jgi:hypothetical protein
MCWCLSTESLVVADCCSDQVIFTSCCCTTLCLTAAAVAGAAAAAAAAAAAELMSACWAADPFSRPSFAAVQQQLAEQLERVVQDTREATERFISDL